MTNMAPQTQTLLGLTDVGNDSHGATETAKHLLQTVGRDIMSFQRNTHASYMAAERAQDIYKAIIKCISIVENSPTGDWESFEKYSEAIDPLEEMLFKLLAFSDDEKGQHLAKTGSTDECVLSAETWAGRRTEIFEILNIFYTLPELKKLFNVPETQTWEGYYQEAQFHDDKTLLKELCAQIQAILSNDRNEFPAYVHGIEKPLNKLQNAVINSSPRVPSWLMVLTIKTSMLIEGVVKIAKETTGIEIRNHLKSKRVWEAALVLINELINVSNVINTEPNSPNDANGKYDEFITILGGSTDTTRLPGSYMQLMKKVGHIRRPFQAQAVTVVMLCRFLGNEFTKFEKSARTIEKLNSLEETFNHTLDVLDGAAKAVPELKTFGLEDFENHGTVKAFADSVARIKGSFESLNLSTEWTKKKAVLADAVEKDRERLTKLQGILSRGPSSPPPKINVNVTIHGNSPDGTQLDITSVEGERTMRLSALRWSVAGMLEPEEQKRAARNGTFFEQSGNDWSEITAAHSTLEEIAGASGGSAVTLKLVIPYTSSNGNREKDAVDGKEAVEEEDVDEEDVDEEDVDDEDEVDEEE